MASTPPRYDASTGSPAPSSRSTVDEKMRIRMALGGRAWRGYFPVGAELTSGKPDQKEGLYFGAELDDDASRGAGGHAAPRAQPLPGAAGRAAAAVLDHLAAMTRLGHRLMEGIALALGLERAFFADRYTGDPLILFRIFHYPPLPAGVEAETLWSVGEHTDYGLLTILMQDEIGGLAVKSKGGWIEAPPIEGSFVCNIGDMLDRMTGGLYRSTPHRVRNRSDRGRLSFPFFFDPGWNARIEPIPTGAAARDDRDERWDHASVHEFSGTYGDYLLRKVGRVFPDLGDTRSLADAVRSRSHARSRSRTGAAAARGSSPRRAAPPRTAGVVPEARSASASRNHEIGTPSKTGSRPAR